MGGLTTAALLANENYKVLVLEAAHALGGCSSSYYRQGYWFETGATTLIGFDKYQPLRYLEQQTGIHIPREELLPSMQVHLDGHIITRYKDREQWINEAGRVFGDIKRQQKFWELAFIVSDAVWRISLNNNFFPPASFKDLLELIKNNSALDFWILPYALKSVARVMQDLRVDSPKFEKFVNEQLMITAQSKAKDTPFLFGAAGLTYTNYSNFYVPGGLINMVEEIGNFIIAREGAIKTKSPVECIAVTKGGYAVNTASETFTTPVVVSNVPVWNMPSITINNIRRYFVQKSQKYKQAWGAFTIGMVTNDCYPDALPLHHQLHFDRPGDDLTGSNSIFVSLSHPDDVKRAKKGHRVLNISMHTQPGGWFIDNEEDYKSRKQLLTSFVTRQLEEKLPGFKESEIVKRFAATPLTWQNWVYRRKGRVGGIPQSMERSLLDWTPTQTPFVGLFLCGDTVFPGQGIPGVTLSGINCFHRIQRYMLQRKPEIKNPNLVS